MYLFRWWSYCIVVVAGLIFGGGCKNSRPEVGDPSLAFRSSKPKDLGSMEDLSCPALETFSNPGIEDPEFPLAEIYRAALMPDTPKAFKRFEGQFVSAHDASFLREQQWLRVREHVRKYVLDPDSFSFQICRRETKRDGTLKVFVRSHDKRKSHPPCTLVQEDGAWKVHFFTY